MRQDSDTSGGLVSLLDGWSGRLERDFPLAEFTTYRLGGPASVYLEPAGRDDLEILARALRSIAPERIGPVLVMGRGSNLVISDRGWHGVVVRLGARFSWIEEEGNVGLRAGAGTPLPLLANWSARRDLEGLEFFVAIPGSVGGAVRMNAGAHGAETSTCLRLATILDLESGDVKELSAGELGLSYRASNLTERQVVMEAHFELVPSSGEVVRERMESFRRHRAETQPGAVQNAGSVFKNPADESAGRLVEKAGLKGFRVGGASVSELHANFFMAGPGASSQDVFDLVRAVQARVLAQLGVALEPEIRFAGQFEGEAPAAAKVSA